MDGVFGDGSQQVDDIQVFAQLDHDLQLGHERADLVGIRAGLGHFDGDHGVLPSGGQPDGLCLQHSTERSRPDLTTCRHGHTTTSHAYTQIHTGTHSRQKTDGREEH